MCVCLWRPEVDIFIYYYTPYFFETWLSFNLKLSISAGLTGQEAPGTCPSLLPQHCRYRQLLLHLAFMWVLLIWIQSLLFAQQALHALNDLSSPNTNMCQAWSFTPLIPAFHYGGWGRVTTNSRTTCATLWISGQLRLQSKIMSKNKQKKIRTVVGKVAQWGKAPAA